MLKTDEASILSNDFPAGFPTSSEEIKDVNDTKKKMNIDKNATTQPPSVEKTKTTRQKQQNNYKHVFLQFYAQCYICILLFFYLKKTSIKLIYKIKIK